jgi:hypothetical protein
MMAKGCITRRHWIPVMVGGFFTVGTQVGCAMAPRPRGFGVVVTTGLIRGTGPKYGVEVKSDSGRYLMGHASLSGGGGSAGYGGLGLPQWVDVSWRTGRFIQRFDPITKSVWTGGTVVGQYRIEVASRIPQDVINYASAERGRAIKLMFRILDDAVVLGWSVQEASKMGGGWIYSNFGGDFVPAEWVEGVVVRPGWYLDRTTGQRVETTTQ